MRPDLLAYYFPHWHPDPRDSDWIEPGFDEWRLVRAARPRYPGHRQPRVPTLGYRDETDPSVMREEVELARTHGIRGFIFDYYWYEDGPYLQQALDHGFLRSGPADGFTFSLMWANHDLVDVFPLTSPTAERPPRLLRPGQVSGDAFDAMTTHVVEAYFSNPAYYRIDGRPLFSIYELTTFITGLGGVEQAAQALLQFNEKAQSAGHAGVHFDAVIWGTGILPGSKRVQEPAQLLTQLGFSSASSYTWLHHIDLAAHDFPEGDWDRVRRDVFREYASYATRLGVPFLPNISLGWDCSPRTEQTTPWERQEGYGWTPSFECSTPTILAAARDCIALLQQQAQAPPIVTINAWNEWTEGSYLLPDEDRGLELLDAVAAAFPVTQDTDVTKG